MITTDKIQLKVDDMKAIDVMCEISANIPVKGHFKLEEEQIVTEREFRLDTGATHTSLNVEQIKNLCKNAKVVLLDNADLYLTNELLSWFIEKDKMLIICMKDTSCIDMVNMSEFIVNYKDKYLTIEEF